VGYLKLKKALEIEITKIIQEINYWKKIKEELLGGIN